MFAYMTAILAASASLASATVLPRTTGSASMTPHDHYSSSIGVLGCKINTNRVAYWPGSVGCDDICIKVSNGDRSLYLLRIDSSAGAHDISYDAWNYLGFGESATADPHQGNGIDMNYEIVHPSKCADLLDDGKVPLSACNSMNYVASCISSDTWVGKNYKLYNIQDPVCKVGVDETCTLDLKVSNQPSCPSTLGSVAKLDLEVTNIAYGTGKKVAA